MHIKKLGSLIKKERKKRKLTQTQLAKLSNTSINFIAQIEKGKESAHVGKIFSVLSVLGIELLVSYGQNTLNFENIAND